MAHDQNRSFLLSYNYVIRPSLINEFRFGFTNFQENDNFPIQGSSAISVNSGCKASISASIQQATPFRPSTSRTASFSSDRTGSDWNNDFAKICSSPITLRHIVDNHTLRFGVDVRKVSYNALMFFQPSDDFGDFTFSPGLFSNYSFGDFLLGMPQQSFFADHQPADQCAHDAIWRLWSGRVASEQPCNGEFRLAVGTASAV